MTKMHLVKLMPTEAVCDRNRRLKKCRRLLLLYEVCRHVMALIRMLRHVKICDKKWITETWWRPRPDDGRLRWRGLHLLSDHLCLMHLLLLVGCIRILGMTVCVLLILRVPAPFGLQLCVHEADPPARLLTDLVEDLQDFFLFSSIRKTLARNSKGAQCYTCNTTVLDMGADAADELRVLLDHAPHLWLV